VGEQFLQILNRYDDPSAEVETRKLALVDKGVGMRLGDPEELGCFGNSEYELLVFGHGNHLVVKSGWARLVGGNLRSEFS
jgi:hypothetical protein